MQQVQPPPHMAVVASADSTSLLACAAPGPTQAPAAVTPMCLQPQLILTLPIAVQGAGLGAACPNSCAPVQQHLQLRQRGPAHQHKQRSRRRQQQQQLDDNLPSQLYAESTVFFAGVSPIATQEALLCVFQEFGRVVHLSVFRPYRTSKTSKVGCQLI